MDPTIDDMDPSSAKDLTEAQRMFNKMWHTPQTNALANRVNALVSKHTFELIGL